MSSEVCCESCGSPACQSTTNKRNGSSCKSWHFRGKGFALRKFLCLPKFSVEIWFQLKIAYSHLDDFCKLPEDTKELYLRNTETGNHGYVRPGQEKFDGKKKDIRHAYNICTLNLKLPEEVIKLFAETFSPINWFLKCTAVARFSWAHCRYCQRLQKPDWPLTTSISNRRRHAFELFRGETFAHDGWRKRERDDVSVKKTSTNLKFIHCHRLNS